MRYHEEIQHPALSEPEIATGTMWVEEDGTLFRQQVSPRGELAEIGETVLRLTRDGEDAPTLHPIPDEMDATIAALRFLLLAEQAPGDPPDPETVASGWVLRFGEGRSVSVFGCGSRADRIELHEPSGGLRTIRFIRTP